MKNNSEYPAGKTISFLYKGTREVKGKITLSSKSFIIVTGEDNKPEIFYIKDIQKKEDGKDTNS